MAAAADVTGLSLSASIYPSTGASPVQATALRFLNWHRESLHARARCSHGGVAVSSWGRCRHPARAVRGGMPRRKASSSAVSSAKSRAVILDEVVSRRRTGRGRRVRRGPQQAKIVRGAEWLPHRERVRLQACDACDAGGRICPPRAHASIRVSRAPSTSPRPRTA